MLRKYWLEILTFGVIAGVMLLDLAPDATWINVDSDGMHLVYAAKYLYPAHQGSAPLYLLMGHLILYLPIGTDFWRLGLLSVFGGVASSVLVYLIIRQLLPPIEVESVWSFIRGRRILPDARSARYYALAGALLFGGSALAISQATVVKYYTVVSAFMLAAYWFALKEQWKRCAVMMGCAGAIHPIAICTIIPLLVKYKPLRAWRHLAIGAAFILFYLYIPITNRPPYVWDMPERMGALSFVVDTLAKAGQLSGALSIWDFPKRVFDTIGIMGVSLAIVGVVPVVVYFWRRSVLREPLFWMITIPVVYYASDLAPQVYTYMVPALAFAAVVVGLGLARMSRLWLWAIAFCAVGFLVFNANYFDVGRTLDPELSASRYYHEELPKVPDGEILMTQYGWEWSAVFDYNQNEGRRIIPLYTGQLVGAPFRHEFLDKPGIPYRVPAGQEADKDWALSTQAELALSIIELNPNIWITEISDPRTYGVQVTKPDDKILAELRDMDTRLKAPIVPQWQWKPSNPYDILTGAIEVESWNYIVVSNWNVLFFAGLISGGLILNWLIFVLPTRRKRHEDTVLESEETAHSHQ